MRCELCHKEFDSDLMWDMECMNIQSRWNYWRAILCYDCSMDVKAYIDRKKREAE